MAYFAPKQTRPRKRAPHRGPSSQRDTSPAPGHAPSSPGGNALAGIDLAPLARVGGASASLPHLDRIQAAFGPLDLGDVRAVVSGDAATLANSVDARAFTLGN